MHHDPHASAAPTASRRLPLLAAVLLLACGGCASVAEVSKETSYSTGDVTCEAPAVVAMTNGGGLCTATLLDARTAVTAAHCVDDLYGHPDASSVGAQLHINPTNVAGNVEPDCPQGRASATIWGVILDPSLADLAIVYLDDWDDPTIAETLPFPSVGDPETLEAGDTISSFGYGTNAEGAIDWNKRRADYLLTDVAVDAFPDAEPPYLSYTPDRQTLFLRVGTIEVANGVATGAPFILGGDSGGPLFGPEGELVGVAHSSCVYVMAADGVYPDCHVVYTTISDYMRERMP